MAQLSPVFVQALYWTSWHCAPYF